MDSKKLEILMTAVDLGSFSKASEVVGYTQSGLTHLVDSLEREIGLTLVRRDHSGIALTEEGEALMPAIREFLRANAKLENRIAAITEKSTRTIRVAAYASIAMRWMPEILYRFRRGYCIGFHGLALGGSAFGRRSQAPEEPAEPVQPLLRVQRGAEHSADDQGHHNQYRAGNFQLAVRQRKQRAQSAGKSCHAHDQPACQHDDFLIPRAQLPAEHDARVACHDHGQHVYDQSQYCHRKILLIPPVLRLPLL